MKVEFAFTITALILLGCASRKKEKQSVLPPKSDFRIQINDVPSSERFEIILISNSRVPLCLSVYDLPRKSGGIGETEFPVTVSVANEEYGLYNWTQEICVGNCVIAVKPRQTELA